MIFSLLLLTYFYTIIGICQSFDCLNIDCKAPILYHLLMNEIDVNRGIRTGYQAVDQYVNNVKQFPRVRSFFWLLRCADVLNKYATMEVGTKGVTRTGLAVLQILIRYPEGVPQQTIAKETGLTKQAIVVAIDNLVKKGHVIRCTDIRDRRANSIRITQEGLDFLGEVFPHTLNMCHEALASLSDAEIDQLLPLIIKLTTTMWQKTVGTPIDDSV